MNLQDALKIMSCHSGLPRIPKPPPVYQKPRIIHYLSGINLCHLLDYPELYGVNGATWAWIRDAFEDACQIHHCTKCDYFRPCEEFDHDLGICKWCGDPVYYGGEPA